MDGSPDFSSCSVEKLLAVPLEYIFRETRTAQNGLTFHSPPGKSPGGSQRNFLFSRSEVSSLMRVSLLASEMDILLQMVYKALDRSQKCQVYREIIQSTSGSNSTNTVYFRSLLPILHVHAESTSEILLNHATSDVFGINRILNELDSCAIELTKFAEQNWNMAEQFDLAMMPGQINLLSEDKRAIAEIEEAIAERIQNLKVMTMGFGGDNREDEGKSMMINDADNHDIAINNESSKLDAFDKAYDEGSTFCSMERVCERVFNVVPSTLQNGGSLLPRDSDNMTTPLARRESLVNEDNFNQSQISVSVQNAAAALQVMGAFNQN